MKVLVFGRNGLVGNSIKEFLINNPTHQSFFSTRKDTDCLTLKKQAV